MVKNIFIFNVSSHPERHEKDTPFSYPSLVHLIPISYPASTSLRIPSDKKPLNNR